MQKSTGIVDNQIVAITSETLSGKKALDVTGSKVSPGFIDLHVHRITNEEQEYQANEELLTLELK